MQQPPSHQPTIDKKLAELLARLINTLFNNMSFYGAKHPTTQRSAAELFFQLSRILDRLPVLSFIAEHDSFYVEEWCVDDRINARKLMAHLKKFSIQSISFFQKLQLDAINEFIAIIENTDKFHDADGVEQALRSRGFDTVRVNYVLYKKVTADEAIVDKDAVGAVPPAAGAGRASPTAPAPAVQDQIMGAAGTLMSMQEIFVAPAPGNEQAAPSPAMDQALILRRMRDLKNTISSAPAAAPAMSPEEMLQAVTQLSSEVRQSLELRRQMGALPPNESDFVNEMQELTYQTIVRLASDEYRKAGISAQRLAQTIRKMAPEAKDIKQLLPRLKDGLTAAGMPLTDFLALVKELNQEMQNENLAAMLAEAGESMGVSLGEIVKNIKENPADAARLIILASEIRKGTQADDAQLSNLLTTYVEQVGSQMVLQSQQSGPSEAQPLETMLGTVERQLIDKLKSQGVSESVLKRVEEQTSGGRRDAIGKLKSQWLLDFIAAEKTLSFEKVHRLIGSVVAGENDLAGIRDPLRDLLLQRGFTRPQVDELLAHTKKTGVAPAAAPPPLPKGVLTSNNALFFLKHQIGLTKRYNTPFSVLMITVAGINDGSGWRKATLPEANQILPDIFTLCTGILRELDLVGSLSTIAQHIPFIILPMTPGDGAAVVKKRIEIRINQLALALDGKLIKAKPAVSSTAYDKEKSGDMMEFLKSIKLRHKAEEDVAKKGLQ
jgi:hypothetical protein